MLASNDFVIKIQKESIYVLYLRIFNFAEFKIKLSIELSVQITHSDPWVKIITQLQSDWSIFFGRDMLYFFALICLTLSQDNNQFVNNMEPDKSRLRKSLAAMRIRDQKTGKLISTDERKGYFYCLKLLGVLPPPPNSGFEKWTYYSRAANLRNRTDQQLYIPKCLHDVLIASHATTCEHQSLYFSYYHRHLLILTEIFLNFAHQVLRGGQKKLRQVYTGRVLDIVYNKQNEALWNDVFKVYNNLKGIPNQIANHYWNPTNYLNDEDLTVLEELAPKYTSDKEVKDPIDILFFNINNSYPWQINAPRRWYNKPERYNWNDISRLGLFNQVYQDYTFDQKKLINGELDPRKDIYIFQQRNFIQTWLRDSSNIILNRNFQNNKKDRQNYGTNSILDKELLANYGAKSKNLHYISQQQKNYYHLTNNYVISYNAGIPHYSYAQALFNPDIINFFHGNKHIQTSHITMHNNFNTILNDPTYSPTSLMFFPYHGWIDCGIQLYIRKNNGQGQGPFNQLKKILNFQYPVGGVLRSIIRNAENLIKQQLQWRISGVNKDNQGNVTGAGTYPIPEYISPQFPQSGGNTLKVLEASFCARDYILTQSNIRDSLHLNDIYQNYYIDRLHRNRFYFLKIKDYNFDYDYVVEAEPNNWQRLDIYANNLPRYLKNMEKQFVKNRTVRFNALSAAQGSTISDTRGQTGGSQTVTATKHAQVQKPQLLIKLEEKEIATQPIPQVDVEEENQKIGKLFQTGLHLIASYPPDTKNGNNFIQLNLKNAIQEYRKSQKDLLEQIQQVQVVGNIEIFGKESFAEICPKCQNNKVQFLDLDENLRVRLPKLWQFIHTNSLNKKLYDSQDKQNQIVCISRYISLIPNETFKDYRFSYGAEEIEVSIIDRTDKNKNESQYIRLDAESYSVSNNVINSVLSKKFYTFNSKSFDFYKIFDVFNENENDYFDRYVYKRLKGVIFVGPKKIEFNISVPSYQRLLRLNLEIIGDSQDLRVVVKDADYNAKQVFYNAAIQREE